MALTSTHGDFYPRSPRGERLDRNMVLAYLRSISIHAPREGSDALPIVQTLFGNKFLSTLPARGATDYRYHPNIVTGISIHAPREGSDCCRCCWRRQYPISIHAPREGSDLSLVHFLTSFLYFYPRSPRGERPLLFGALFCHKAISIHAPREGSDLSLVHFLTSFLYFYPRSPRGERPLLFGALFCHKAISIHAPREGSDPVCRTIHRQKAISIHAPREGSDKSYRYCPASGSRFLSTLPARGATP